MKAQAALDTLGAISVYSGLVVFPGDQEGVDEYAGLGDLVGPINRKRNFA